MVDDVLRPAGANDRQQLVEHACPFAPLDTERLLLVRVGDTESERR